jgi:hypothetical protein
MRLTLFKVEGRVYQLTKYRVDVDGPRPESYMEDRQLAQQLPPEEVSPSTWKTAKWLSICLQTRCVSLPGRPPAGSASDSKTRWVPLHGRPPDGSVSACRPGKSLYLEDHQLAQHLPLDQVSLSTWKTISWLSICLQTRSVPLPGRPPAGSASASRPGKSLYPEDHRLAQHLPPDQVSPYTWKTTSWLSICLKTRCVSLPRRPASGSASAYQKTASWLIICL